MHEHWGASLVFFILEHSFAKNHKTFVHLVFQIFFDCLLPSGRILEVYHLICNLLILNIVWSPFQLFVIGFVHLISLILWEMHTLWGSSYYIGLLIFSRPFRQWIPMGERFRGFKGIWFYALVLFLRICLSCSCILSCSIAWFLNSLYKPS